MKRLPLAIMLVLSVVLTATARANVKMPAIFGDHMVLQRDMAVPVWGWAEPGEKVTVSTGSVSAEATADASGKWMVRLAALPAQPAGGQGIELTITGRNTIRFADVLVGDVWVCSGQSNMAFPLSGAHNAAEVLPQANQPQIRLFTVARTVVLDPRADCVGKWVVCTPETAREFSAVGYFFARELHQTLNAPIGLIGTYFNGSPAEAWVSLPALKAEPQLAPLVTIYQKICATQSEYQSTILPQWRQEMDRWRQEVEQPYQASLTQWTRATAAAKAAGKPQPPKPQPARPQPAQPPAPPLSFYTPSSLFNGMISPIVPYGIKGVIWYQGETNAGNSWQYRTLFPALIADWRKNWDQGEFPFLYVQLANFMARAAQPTDTAWANLRDAQRLSLSVPNTAQAVAIDIGDGSDIHPKDKLDVGHRLALAARHVAYGQDLVYSGPMYQSMRTEGQRIRLSFTHVGGGLTVARAPATQPSTVPTAPPASTDSLKGFTIAGPNRKFVWADARIDGDTVVVWSDQVQQPTAVRYGWADNPEVNLYNKEGLPASPFRTDEPPPPAARK